MRQNPNVEKATAVLQARFEQEQIRMDPPYITLTWRQEAEALDAAGLLVTPLHERALKACEDFAKERERWGWFEKFPVVGSRGMVTEHGNLVQAIGRESLAAKKPKERWTVRRENNGWWVDDNAGKRRVSFWIEEKHARAVADALNALEGK